MSDKTATSLFMFSPSLGKYAGFYQELVRGFVSYEQLGNRLIQLAERAHAFRQFDKVREYGLVLSNIPIKRYQSAGHYYLAVSANSRGNGDQGRARKLFENVVDTAPESYKAKAILSLAAVALHAKDYQSQLGYLIESARTSLDVSTKVRAHLGIAIYKSMEGFHKQSLGDLENLYPLARLSSPIVYFDYLNSLAVELGENGRKDEARNISRIVLASPFAYAYPEWQETANDLRGSRRSFAVIDPSPRVHSNVLAMPAFERDGAEFPTWAGSPARVIGYEEWKKRMSKGKKKNGGKIEDMTERDVMLEIIRLTSDETTTFHQQRQILAAIHKILSKPSEPGPDTPTPDDDEGA